MLRAALKPRWLALLAVVLVAATAMAALGSWQLHRARERTEDSVRARQQAAPRELTALLPARQTFPGRLRDAPVIVRGHWDATHQVVVTGPPQEARGGDWVLTPLVLADGSAVPVVRGRLPAPEAGDVAGAAPAPSADGEVEVRGLLRPADPPPQRNPGDAARVPAGRLTGVDVTALVKLWPYPLTTGYVIATEPSPDPASGLLPVDTVSSEVGGLALQNLSYALQWWIFALLGLFFWWRLVRDDARGVLRPADGAPADVGDDGAAPEERAGSGRPTVEQT